MSQAITIPTQFLTDLQPDKFALLQNVIPNMTDDMLWRIAQADYGHEAIFCMEELRKIKKNQAPPKKIEFALHEVLELTRWTNAETEKDHWMRLFACTNLLMIAHDTETMGENQTIANMLESLLSLDDNLVHPTIQLFAWRLIEDEQDAKFYQEETAFFIYALLYLLLLLKKPTAQIRTLFDWLVTVEAKERAGQEWNPSFLLGISVFDQRHYVWKELTQQLIPQLDYLEDTDLKEEMLIVLQWIVAYKKIKKRKKRKF